MRIQSGFRFRSVIVFVMAGLVAITAAMTIEQDRRHLPQGLSLSLMVESAKPTASVLAGRVAPK